MKRNLSPLIISKEKNLFIFYFLFLFAFIFFTFFIIIYFNIFFYRSGLTRPSSTHQTDFRSREAKPSQLSGLTVVTYPLFIFYYLLYTYYMLDYIHTTLCLLSMTTISYLYYIVYTLNIYLLYTHYIHILYYIHTYYIH